MKSAILGKGRESMRKEGKTYQQVQPKDEQLPEAWLQEEQEQSPFILMGKCVSV